MESRRLRAGIVLVLAVVALGAAGASMGDSGSGGGSTGLGDGSGSGMGSGDSGIFSQIQELHPLFDGAYLAMAIGIVAILGALAGVVGLAMGLLNWDWEQFKEILREYAAKGLGLAIVGGVLFLLLRAFSPSTGGGSTGLGGEGDAEGAGAASNATGLELPAIMGIAILLAVLVVIALMLNRSGGEETVDAEPEAAVVESEPSQPATVDSGGRLGGGGVGRVPADNEVYRAWLELADVADANARRETPREVADSAVAEGVDPDAAREITSLFEAVRYGGTDPDEGVEERASRARGRIGGGR